MRMLHTMIRVLDLDRALAFFDVLGFREVRRRDSERGRFTLVFLDSGDESDSHQIELTHNWDEAEPYSDGRNFGHIAIAVEDIYDMCERLEAHDSDPSSIKRWSDGVCAFTRQISIELLQDEKHCRSSLGCRW